MVGRAKYDGMGEGVIYECHLYGYCKYIFLIKKKRSPDTARWSPMNECAYEVVDVVALEDLEEAVRINHVVRNVTIMCLDEIWIYQIF